MRYILTPYTGGVIVLLVCWVLVRYRLKEKVVTTMTNKAQGRLRVTPKCYSPFEIYSPVHLWSLCAGCASPASSCRVVSVVWCPQARVELYVHDICFWIMGYRTPLTRFSHLPTYYCNPATLMNYFFKPFHYTNLFRCRKFSVDSCTVLSSCEA